MAEEIWIPAFAGMTHWGKRRNANFSKPVTLRRNGKAPEDKAEMMEGYGPKFRRNLEISF